MNRRIGGSIIAALGVLLIAGGLVVKFAVVPMQKQWPADASADRVYEGTLVALLNQQALQSGDVANVFLNNVPITIDRHVATASTQDGKALVEDRSVLKGPGGTEIQVTDKWYTIDRKTMNHVSGYTGTIPAGAQGMIQDQRQGLVIGFPIGTEQKLYQGWSDDYQSLVDLNFVAVEDHNGLRTYHFESTSGPQPEKDTTLGLPPALPKALLLQLAPALASSNPGLVAQLAPLLGSLPDPVPFSYTYEYTTEYWVEPVTGVIVDYSKTEKRVALLEAGGQSIPVVTVSDLNYKQTADSVTTASNEAKDKKSTLNTFGTIVPWAAIGVGVLLLLGGGAMLMMRKKPAATPPSATPSATS